MKNSPGADKGTSFKLEAFYKIIKRSFFRATGRKEVSLTASMTVESSIALPLFIFFFANILVMFNIIKVQTDLEAALHQAGNRICLISYDEKEAAQTIVKDTGAIDFATGVASIFYAKELVHEYLGEGIDKSCVTDGFSGMSFRNSRIMAGNDIVDIVVDYKVHPLISLIGFKEFPVEGRYYGHAWTGYDITGEGGSERSEEEMVYVTEHGEVYHRNINCKHLKLNVHTINYESVKNARNADRGKYYACEYCAKRISAGSVFITDYGDRYHSSVSCPGLKRKIYTIPISEVGGRRPCSSCGR
ncbi:hypothetical protein D6856_04775 [Butyrivibrio sp. XB500-5]|uniref:TadE/TadG family type IV pilus assembly protein n=1 Tax=Butyrivibrio sp. XB500-5 TaxID=2364880 RepID=UPI000EA9CB31|nr:hypothetical protein [Butyrivibrio sp. XB500-5]RKM61521.1 hypothetical protein D6856_04775 [Butyrivibrio sp. XB500-5]